MNQYLIYDVAKAKQAELLRQSQENRQFARQRRTGTQRVSKMIWSTLDGASRYLRSAMRVATTKRNNDPTDLRPEIFG